MRTAGLEPLSPPGAGEAHFGVWKPALGLQLFKVPQVWRGNGRVIRCLGTVRPWRISMAVAALWTEGSGDLSAALE